MQNSSLFPSLDELVEVTSHLSMNQILKQYEVKIAGLIVLERFKDEKRKANIMECTDFYVPPLFFVPKTQSITSKESKDLLREQFYALGDVTCTRPYYDMKDAKAGEKREPCMILIRETEVHETPGDLETKLLVFNPNDKEGSFERFYSELRRLKADGHALIVQGGLGFCSKIDADAYHVRVAMMPISLDNVNLTKLFKDVLSCGRAVFDAKIFHTGHCQLKEFRMNIAEELFGRTGYTLEEIENDNTKFENSLPAFKQYLKEAIAGVLPNAQINYEVHVEMLMRDTTFKKVYLPFSEIHNALELWIEYEQEKMKDRPVIGARNLSMVARSHDHFKYGNGSVDICGGLATKLVRDVQGNIVTIYFTKESDGNHHDAIPDDIPAYRGNSCAAVRRVEFDQKEVEFFDIATGRVLRTSSENILWSEYHDGKWPVPVGTLKNLEKITQLALELSIRLGLCVELEAGSEKSDFQFNNQEKRPRYYSEDGISIIISEFNRLAVFQLTTSPIPVDVIDKVSDIEDERIIKKTDYFFGSIFHEGDLILYEGRDEKFALELLFEYRQRGETPLIFDYGAVSYEDLSRLGIEKRLSFDNYSGQGNHHHNACLAGWVTKVYEEYRIRLCTVRGTIDHDEILAHSLAKDHIKLYDKEKGLLILRNMGVEAAKGTFQMYFK